MDQELLRDIEYAKGGRNGTTQMIKPKPEYVKHVCINKLTETKEEKP